MDLRQHAMSCADATKQAFDRLAVNGCFGFVADADPTALRCLFEAEQAGQFTWDRPLRMTTGADGRGEFSVPSSVPDALSERMMTHHG